ncbi:phosphoheptose isomerase [Candidatus Marinamargulisbacteria bacterium SCGC AG-410-N11]|nr:phosphoheptose isomerase [Candidatus Marinamargulisbacteria bacterium SCGC AG-410-N11]
MVNQKLDILKTSSLYDIKKSIQGSIDLKKLLLDDEIILNTILEIVTKLTHCFRNKNKVFFCGNGGSAADAQHLAAEFSGRFYFDRDPLFAEALHVNTSYLTAVANDYSYEQVYSRMVKAKLTINDILICLSTSGNSSNIIQALNQAKKQNVYTIGLSGQSGGKMSNLCSLCIKVPSNDTPRIQEVHMLIGHIICELTEANLFPN